LLKRLYILILVISFGIAAAQVPPGWQWVQTDTGTDSENGNAIATDPSGNIIVTGYFSSTPFVLGSYSLTNAGIYDFYAAKYDPFGNVLWAMQGGGTGSDMGLGVTCDQSGNVYITGYFYSPTFTISTYTLTNSGVGDIFVAKISPGGSLLWVRSFGSTNEENGNAITSDNSGNIYFTGFFRSAQLVMDTYTLTNSGSSDSFLSQIDNSGNILWARSFTCTANDAGSAIACDLSGNILLTGYFNTQMSLDTFNLTGNGSSDVYTTKTDASGNVLWANSAGGGLNDYGLGITRDNAGNVIVTGNFLSSTLIAGPDTLHSNGYYDVLIMKYNAGGALLWAHSQGGIFDDTGVGVITDNHSDIYLTGHFHSPSIIIGADTLENQDSNQGDGDCYLAKYSAAGNNMWATGFGGVTDDGTSAICRDAFENVFITGYYNSPSISFSTYTLTNSGLADIFVAKLNNPVTSLQSMNEGLTLTVYPNPTAGEIFISSGDLKIESVELLSVTGVKILQQESASANSLDLAFLPAGTYFLMIRTEKGNIGRKIIRL
jgi:hypothetical protein